MEGLLPDLELIRKDFPILQRTLAAGRSLVYLDSANTSQKPQVVIDTMVDHLERHNANVARAMHQLGAESSEAFEAARDKVAAFIKAPSRDEVVFTKNASEALNLVANTFAWARGDLQLGAGDEVVITEMEHHSNIVPWQLLTERTGATLRWFGLTDDGRLGVMDFGSVARLPHGAPPIIGRVTRLALNGQADRVRAGVPGGGALRGTAAGGGAKHSSHPDPCSGGR